MPEVPVQLGSRTVRPLIEEFVLRRSKESGQLLLLGVSIFPLTWFWEGNVELKQRACRSCRLQTFWVSPFYTEPLPTLFPCLAKSKSEVNEQMSFLCQVLCLLLCTVEQLELHPRIFHAELRQVFTLQHTLFTVSQCLSTVDEFIFSSELHLTYMRDLSKNVFISYVDVIVHSTFLFIVLVSVCLRDLLSPQPSPWEPIPWRSFCVTSPWGLECLSTQLACWTVGKYLLSIFLVAPNFTF